jgi:aerotaxis receptor
MLIAPISIQEYVVAHGSLLVSNADAQRRITYCNAALLEASGYTRGELLGKPLALLDHPDMPQEVRRDLWAALEAGDTWSAVVQHRRKDGQAYWVQTTAALLRDAPADALYVIAHARPRHDDVRAAKRLYAAMRKASALWREAMAGGLLGEATRCWSRSA